MPDNQSITVLHTFHLIRQDGTERVFEPGVYNDISEDDLKHWWVKVNIGHSAVQPSKPTSYEYQTQTPVTVAVDHAVKFVQATEAAAVAKEEQEQLEARNASRLERNKGYAEMLADVRANGMSRYLEMVDEQEKRRDPKYLAAAGEAGAVEENGDEVDEVEPDGSVKKVKKTTRAVLSRG